MAINLLSPHRVHSPGLLSEQVRHKDVMFMTSVDIRGHRNSLSWTEMATPPYGYIACGCEFREDSRYKSHGFTRLPTARQCLDYVHYTNV